MATENKPVMCYLSEELEQYVTQYCTEYNITRKDKDGNIKPALGTGVVDILKRFFIGEGSSNDKSVLPSNVVTKEEFEEFKAQIQPILDAQREIESYRGKLIA